jgi:hypothetical protein
MDPFRRRFASLALGVTVTGACSLVCLPAKAEEGATTAAPPPVASAPRPWVWYGWQVLIADALAAGVGAIAAPENAHGDAGVIGLAAAGYIAGGGVVHLVHGRYLAAGLSLGVRLLLPVVGALVGSGIASTSCHSGDTSPDGYPEDPCWAPLGGGLVGFVSGMVTASVVDIAAFSWERAPAPDGAPARQATGVWLLPRVVATEDASHRRLVSVGVAGAF